jgi:hypothetical protein
MKRTLIVMLLWMGGPATAQEPPPAQPSAPADAAPAAPNPKEDARRLFMAGKQAYQAGRVDVAAQSFEEAYRLDAAPGLLFNLAQTYRKLYLINGDPKILKKAVDDYRRYLAEAATGPNRALATEALTELAPILARVAPEELAPKTAMPTPTPTPGETVAVTPPPTPSPASEPPPRPKTEVMIVTETENATVKLDGQQAAPAPLLAQVAPGPHHATVEAEGFFPAEVRVIAVDGRLITGEARLQPKPGHVQLDGSSGGTVAVDGRDIGHLPLPALELPAGRHVITVVERGRNPWVNEVQVDRDKSTRLYPELPQTTQRRAAKWLLGVTCVAAAAAAAAGAVWGTADSSASDLLNKYNTGTLTLDELNQYNSDRTLRDSWRTGTYVAIGITGALAVITGALYLFDHQPAPRVVPRSDLPGTPTAAR